VPSGNGVVGCACVSPAKEDDMWADIGVTLDVAAASSLYEQSDWLCSIRTESASVGGSLQDGMEDAADTSGILQSSVEEPTASDFISSRAVV